MVDDALSVGGDVAVRDRRDARDQYRNQTIARVETDQGLGDEQVVADRVLIVREQRVERARVDVVGDAQDVRLSVRRAAAACGGECER